MGIFSDTLEDLQGRDWDCDRECEGCCNVRVITQDLLGKEVFGFSSLKSLALMYFYTYYCPESTLTD